jgi:hypothetical protein
LSQDSDVASRKVFIPSRQSLGKLGSSGGRGEVSRPFILTNSSDEHMTVY